MSGAMIVLGMVFGLIYLFCLAILGSVALTYKRRGEREEKEFRVMFLRPEGAENNQCSESAKPHLEGDDQ